MSASSAQPTGGVTIVGISSGITVSITLPARTITLSELQRLKRQFVTVHKKAITLGTTERGAVDWSEGSVANKFVEYVEEHL
jgi:protein KTI12